VSFWSRAGVGHMLSGDSITMQRPGMGDVPSGMFLAGGVAAALFSRERTGKGVVVDVSLLAAGLWTLGPDMVATSVLGEEPPRASAAGATALPLVGTFSTSDDRVIMLSMLATGKYWQPACEALEAVALVAEYDDDEKRRANAAEIRSVLETNIARKPLVHWEERLRARGCIFSKFASPPEILEDPQVEANGYLPRHPVHPTARLVASPVQFDEQPIEVRLPAPERGEHSDEILEAAGVSAAERAALRKSGALG
jgi:crotonobetainyl-CoA:carnitine CoA-transferase CaiB-like acyl-CoA transferase